MSEQVWGAPIEVTQTAKSIHINNIVIRTLHDKEILVDVSWEWRDENNHRIRSGVTRMGEADINNKLVAKGMSVEVFRQLFLSIAAEEAVK